MIYWTGLQKQQNREMVLHQTTQTSAQQRNNWESDELTHKLGENIR
jgi:hypothetical protein